MIGSACAFKLARCRAGYGTAVHTELADIEALVELLRIVFFVLL
jgi:hypothetical protein